MFTPVGMEEPEKTIPEAQNIMDQESLVKSLFDNGDDTACLACSPL